MSAPPEVLTQFAAPDPNAAPLNIGQLVQLLNTLVSSAIQGTYLTYLVQNNPPGSDDHDKIWVEVDSQQRPIAVKTWFNGNWRRVYNGMLGEIRIFSGDPTDASVWTPVAGDTGGLGVVGGTYDGWHICNGKDGVVDLSDRFIIAAHMNNVTVPGWDGSEWVTTEVKDAGEHTGGFREITLTPATTYVSVPEVKVGKYTIPNGGEALASGGNLFGKQSASDDTKNQVLLDAISEITPEPINIIPPFIALGYIIFVGYSTT
jgi:hypothetical protein